MIRHIVSWRMGADRAEQRAADAEGVRQRLEALRGVVPAERIEVGIDLGATEGNWHVVLVSDFATADDLAAYQTHPQHVQAAAHPLGRRRPQLCRLRGSLTPHPCPPSGGRRSGLVSRGSPFPSPEESVDALPGAA